MFTGVLPVVGCKAVTTQLAPCKGAPLACKILSIYAFAKGAQNQRPCHGVGEGTALETMVGPF